VLVLIFEASLTKSVQSFSRYNLAPLSCSFFSKWKFFPSFITIEVICFSLSKSGQEKLALLFILPSMGSIPLLEGTFSTYPIKNLLCVIESFEGNKFGAIPFHQLNILSPIGWTFTRLTLQL